MPIRPSKSRVELYRRVNKLLREQPHTQDTDARQPEIKKRLTDFFPLRDEANRKTQQVTRKDTIGAGEGTEKREPLAGHKNKSYMPPRQNRNYVQNSYEREDKEV